MVSSYPNLVFYFTSIPQTVGLEHAEEVQAALADQARAIRSIPGYVAHATNFFVCAPHGVSHRGIFGLAKPIRQSLAAETRIITVENPVFMY